MDNGQIYSVEGFTKGGKAFRFKKDWMTFVFQFDMNKIAHDPEYKDLEDIDDKGHSFYPIEPFLNMVKECLFLYGLKFESSKSHVKWATHYQRNYVLAGGYGSIITIGCDNELAQYKSSNTIMVAMSGTGYDLWVSYLEDHEMDYKKIEKGLLDIDIATMRPSRMDIALDLWNYPDEFSPLYVNECTEKGNYIGRCKPTWIHSYGEEGIDKSDQRYRTPNEGHTLYFGRGGDKSLRIYNKLAERASSDQVEVLDDIDGWFRWEIQVKHQAAADLWDYYMTHGQDEEAAWRFWLATNYRWITRVGQSKQKNRLRYKNALWYDELIEGYQDAEPIRHEAPLRTYERTHRFTNEEYGNASWHEFCYLAQSYQLANDEATDEEAMDYAFNQLVGPFKRRYAFNQGFDDLVMENYHLGAYFEYKMLVPEDTKRHEELLRRASYMTELYDRVKEEESV